MAHFQTHYDEYGNPVEVRRDEYGDPILIHQTGTTGVHGTVVADVGHGGTGGGACGGAGTDVGMGEHEKEHKGVSGMFHRSGSSSSSSEDDGQGGRRKKKGLKKKIIEKLPGKGHKEYNPQATSTTTPGCYGSVEEHHEKKGVMEKIKEKLPGHHEHH